MLLDPLLSDAEVEQELLGTLMANHWAVVQVYGVLWPHHFAYPNHQLIFDGILEVFKRGEIPDHLGVSEELLERGELENAGARSYLTKLTVHYQFYTPDAIDGRVKVIKDKWLTRSVIGMAYEAGEVAKEGGEKALDYLKTGILNIDQELSHKRKKTLSELVSDYVYELDHPEVVKGIKTQWPKVNVLFNGLCPENLIIIAARPSMGKTSFMLNLVLQAAVVNPVLVFSMEMSANELVGRMIDVQANSSLISVKKEAAAIVNELKINVSDQPLVDISTIRAEVYKHIAEYKTLGAIFIDYLQLMEGDGENQNTRVSSITRGLKLIAKEFKVPVVCLSQLNRGVESRQDKRPMLSDLRDSGSIEQDADTVLMLYRDDYYNPDTAKRGFAELIINKQRSGRVGSVEMLFRGESGRFFDVQ